MLNQYSDHIRECNDIVQDSPAGFIRAGLFVLATIQQQLETVPTILRDFETSGSDSPFAFGSKAPGIDFLQNHGRTLWRDTVRLQSDPIELQRVYLEIPGMSLVKTGFLVQLATGHVGCLDVHNIALHSIPDSIVRPFNVQKVQPKTATRRIETYQNACIEVGGSEFLWRTWCDHVAALRPGNWQDGLEVSALHVDCLTGRERGAMAGLQSGFEFAPKYKTGFEV